MTTTVRETVRGESYSQWVRRVVARRAGPGMIALFDSSVPEPREMLCDLVAAGFAAPVDPRYVSAFAGGNRFVVEHLCRRYDVSRDHLICTAGATSALSLLYRALAGPGVRPGARILVETPGFDLFSDLALQQGIAVDTFALGAGDFRVDMAAVEAALTPDTRLVVLSNLHNPSGMLVPDETLAALARLAEARDLIVLVDEVYADYADRSARPVHAAALSPRLVSIGSLTKIYGLSTLRCGWIVGDPVLLAPVRDLNERTEFGISNLAHAAAAMVMANEARFDAYAHGVVDRARPVVEEYFADWRASGLIGGALPAYGCIAFPRLIGINRTIDFSDWLEDRSGVIVAPGEYFGAPGHVRIGFARDPDQLRRGLDMLGDGLRRYVADAIPHGAIAAR